MIAEPYICIKGRNPGDIGWCVDVIERSRNGELWRRYCDFEREKLRELSKEFILSMWMDRDSGWCIGRGYGFYTNYNSSALIDYDSGDYERDSESSRLLKRAEFLKEVCEKEGVEWLPKNCENCNGDPRHCLQPCPKTPQPKEELRGCGTDDPPVKCKHGSYVCGPCFVGPSMPEAKKCGCDTELKIQCQECVSEMCQMEDPDSHPRPKECEHGELPENIACNKCGAVGEPEEKRWRKALLEFLSIPNAGIMPGEHIDRSDFIINFNDLFRFL